MDSRVSFNEDIDRAIELNEAQKYHDAISILLDLLVKYLKEGKTKSTYVILGHIGSNYLDLNEYHNAQLYMEKALELKNDDAFAALGKYLALHNLDKDELAIQLLFAFEEKYGIGFFDQTIEELLEGLEEGFMTNYEIQIRELAEKYNITIVPGASA